MKRKLIILFIVALALPYSAAAAETGDTKYEDKIKAVFIHHFLRYFQWPGDDAASEYHIAFIGNSPLIPPLEQIAEKTTVNGRKLIINQFENIHHPGIHTCHILFIAEPGNVPVEDILEKARRQNILTVSEQEGFARKGVAVNFVMIEGQIKFEINMDTLKKAGLEPSSQLLKLGILVKEEGGAANDTY